MRYPIAYTLSVLFALVVVAGFYLGGPGHFALPIIAFVLFPPVDHWRGLSRWPSPGALARLSPRTERRYEQALLLAGAVHLALLGWALWAVAATPLAWWQFAGLALSVGLATGLTGIAVAHELVHRNTRLADGAAFLIMSLIGYAHYPIEHVAGHHARVGTPEDPVTARAGESIYAFVPRSAIGGLRFAWGFETARLRRKGKRPLSLANRILRWHLFLLAGIAAIGALLGPASLLLLLCAALVAIFIFESVNYVEHYGLVRERRPDGRLERVGVAHSWNSSHLFANVALFNAGRHCDHHLEPRRPYYRLRHYEDAPQLPHGYATMILIAAVPPLWFRIMDRELARLRAPA